MCHYCGCRQLPLIRDFVAEHDRVVDLGDSAMRAIKRGSLDEAAALIRQARQELVRHWSGEENGIFVAMAERDEQYAAHVEQLVVEHRELAALLERADVADPSDQEELAVAFAKLVEHISREEDGLFPASLIALDGADWDASIAAWRDAHPGESMIPD